MSDKARVYRCSNSGRTAELIGEITSGIPDLTMKDVHESLIRFTTHRKSNDDLSVEPQS